MAFFWILLYGLIFAATENFSFSFAPHAAAIPAFFLYWILLFLIYKKKFFQKTAAVIPARGWRGFLSCLPLLIVPTANLFFFKGIFSLSEALFFSLCAFAEEILFRGYLLNLWQKKIGRLPALIAVSLLFAALHAANLFSGASVCFFIAQCLFAGAAGFALGALALREGSILPGILVHILINLTSVEEEKLALMQGGAVFAATVFCLVYGIFLFQQTKKTRGTHYETLY